MHSFDFLIPIDGPKIQKLNCDIIILCWNFIDALTKVCDQILHLALIYHFDFTCIRWKSSASNAILEISGL